MRDLKENVQVFKVFRRLFPGRCVTSQNFITILHKNFYMYLNEDTNNSSMLLKY